MTDPKEWGVAGRLSDALPHLACGAVTVATLHAPRPALSGQPL